MDASSSVHASTHSISFPAHDDPMGSAISAVRNGRSKRRATSDARNGDADDSRQSKRMREDSRVESAERGSSPPASADTTLVNDVDEDIGPKGKARDDLYSSSVVSALLPIQDVVDRPATPDDRGPQLADEIESELRCGCCTEIAYNPVSLSPCRHFFCGSCVTLHLSHSRAAPNYTRATCPACRTPLTNIAPSRVVQSLIAALLRVYPERSRTERERAQADEIYVAGREIPIPPPRAPNPDLLLPQQQNSANDNLARPCPHCAPHNSFDWSCPQPIPNPDTDRANAWNMDNGPPPGHNHCGACDELYAIGAPTSSRCDMCTTGFCGISVPQVCRSHWLRQVRLLSDYSSLQGLIENGRVYEVFNANPIEVDIFFDYLREAEITPNMIYIDIIEHILATPEGFEPLIANDVFRFSHPLDLRIPDAQYAAARPGADSSSASLPSTLFTADFTDEEDSDGETESRTGSRVTVNELEHRASTNEGEHRMAMHEFESRANGDGISPTTVLPRLADLMRSMRDSDTAPSLTLPVVSRRGAPPMPVPAQLVSSAPSPQSIPRRRRICRECATEVFMHGLKEWWGREMNTKIGKERLPVWVVSRKACPSGEACTEQGNYDHARAFCHISVPVASTDPGASRQP